MLLMFSYHTRAFLLEDFWLGNSEASASLSKQGQIIKALGGLVETNRTSEENLQLTNSTPVALKSLWTFHHHHNSDDFI